jgi:hypothetical protein
MRTVFGLIIGLFGGVAAMASVFRVGFLGVLTSNDVASFVLGAVLLIIGWAIARKRKPAGARFGQRVGARRSVSYK